MHPPLAVEPYLIEPHNRRPGAAQHKREARNRRLRRRVARHLRAIVERWELAGERRRAA